MHQLIFFILFTHSLFIFFVMWSFQLSFRTWSFAFACLPFDSSHFENSFGSGPFKLPYLSTNLWVMSHELWALSFQFSLVPVKRQGQSFNCLLLPEWPFYLFKSKNFAISSNLHQFILKHFQVMRPAFFPKDAFHTQFKCWCEWSAHLSWDTCFLSLSLSLSFSLTCLLCSCCCREFEFSPLLML